VISEKRLWLTADGDVVEEGDLAASTLLVAVGQEVPKGYESVVVKSTAAPANKAVKAPANK
jgi:hypothetical protein